MKPSTRILHHVVGWVITVIIPPVILVTAIFFLLNPVFLNLEYRRPGFPADPLGFTLNERLEYSRVSVNYLVNTRNIDYLEEQVLPDGEPLYNERELSHMVDVKAVVQGAIRCWLIGLVILFATAVWAFKAGWKGIYWRSVSRGGFLTLAIIAFFLIYLLLNFNSLFTRFHTLFFESGTWVFRYSDSLIRLFPLPFWQDCFIVVGLFSLIGGGILGWLGIRNSKQ
ncbi:MAG: TIGR01906 family membrane protein [Anaerolineaceae bacterium]|nr:TIGR01906 family membrane protein [Anaerolineaceae bacterium]MBN2676484.1 TIGR01906 family membrane protein [Anaerolineaceae bacterium]